MYMYGFNCYYHKTSYEHVCIDCIYYIHVCLCVSTCRGTVTAYVEKVCFTK